MWRGGEQSQGELSVWGRSELTMGDLQVLIVSLEFLLLPVDAAGTSALRSAIMGSAWRRVVFDECHEVIKLADVHRPRPGGAPA